MGIATWFVPVAACVALGFGIFGVAKHSVTLVGVGVILLAAIEMVIYVLPKI